MAIKFIKDASTKEANPQVFKTGDTVDFYELYGEEPPVGANEEEIEKNRALRANASEQHWINRGYAEEVKESRPKERKGVKSAPPAEKAPEGADKPATVPHAPNAPQQPVHTPQQPKK